MDFVHHQLDTGRAFRVLTVIDQWSRESVRVVAALETLSARRPLLKATTVDHGTEFASKALDEWAYSARRDALLHPARQAYGERICREFQWAAAGRMPQRA